MPRKIVSYEAKSEASKERYYSFYSKVLKSGKSVSQIKRMNVKQFNKAFGSHVRKKSSLEAQKIRLVKQVQNNINEVVNDYIKKQQIDNNSYKAFLYNESYRLFRVKKEKIKDIGKIEHEKIKKKGQYGVIKVIDLKNEREYYIKYTNEKNLKKRLENLQQRYEIKNFITKFLGVYQYKEYITEQFKKKLKKVNVNV